MPGCRIDRRFGLVDCERPVRQGDIREHDEVVSAAVESCGALDDTGLLGLHPREERWIRNRPEPLPGARGG